MLWAWAVAVYVSPEVKVQLTLLLLVGELEGIIGDVMVIVAWLNGPPSDGELLLHSLLVSTFKTFILTAGGKVGKLPTELLQTKPRRLP